MHARRAYIVYNTISEYEHTAMAHLNTIAVVKSSFLGKPNYICSRYLTIGRQYKLRPDFVRRLVRSYFKTNRTKATCRLLEISCSYRYKAWNWIEIVKRNEIQIHTELEEDTYSGTIFDPPQGPVRPPQLVLIKKNHLQELFDQLGVAAGGVGLPLVIDAGRLGLEQVRRAVVVEAGDQARYAERSAPVALRVLLLDGGHEPGYVLGGDGLAERQVLRLALHLRAVDDDARVRRQSGERHHDVRVQRADLAHRPFLLQHRYGLLLHAEHHAVGAQHADGRAPLAHRFLRVLHLQQMAVGREHRDRSVVAAGHGGAASVGDWWATRQKTFGERA